MRTHRDTRSKETRTRTAKAGGKAVAAIPGRMAELTKLANEARERKRTRAIIEAEARGMERAAKIADSLGNGWPDSWGNACQTCADQIRTAAKETSLATTAKAPRRIP